MRPGNRAPAGRIQAVQGSEQKNETSRGTLKSQMTPLITAAARKLSPELLNITGRDTSIAVAPAEAIGANGPNFQGHVHRGSTRRSYRGERAELPGQKRRRDKREQFAEHVREQGYRAELRRKLRPESHLPVFRNQNRRKGIIAHAASYCKTVGETPFRQDKAHESRDGKSPEN